MNPNARRARTSPNPFPPAVTLLAITSVMVAAAFAHAAAPADVLSPTRWGLVYDVPATKDVKLLANVPYWKDATHSLALDVYLPPRLAKGEKVPVVVFMNAIGDRTGDHVKDWGIYRTWPRLMATQGFAGVAMDADSADVPGSLRRAFAFLASAGAPAGIDGQRVGVYAASANVSEAGRFLLGPDAPKTVRAAALYYGGPPADSLRRDLPVLFVVAASDAPRMAAALDTLWHRVVATGAPWTLQYAAGMPHAFDAFADNDDARRIIQQTIAFWRSHLHPVPQPGWAKSDERELMAALYANDAPRGIALIEPWLAKHPNDYEALLTYGRLLNDQRRFPEALRAMERAYHADSSSVVITAQYGGALVGAQRWAEGARLIERAIGMGWNQSLAYGQLAYAELALNRNEQAVRHYEQAFAIGIPSGTSRGVASYNLACGYARLQRRADALRALETAAAEGPAVARGMASDPDLESLRAEPRFQALVARLPAAPH